MNSKYTALNSKDGLVKMWDSGVGAFDENVIEQLAQTAKMPFIFKHVAAMPDAHFGKGASIGSVIPTINAVIPAAVGVDIGCGMQAIQTNLLAEDLPNSLASLYTQFEYCVPTDNNTRCSFSASGKIDSVWDLKLRCEYDQIVEKYPKIAKSNSIKHLGTLGGGNHFLELCLDQNDKVWLMVHSGSRGIGNAIGRFFIDKAKKEMQRWYINLPNEDLAYLTPGSRLFGDYVFSVNWAQKFAALNRSIMIQEAFACLSRAIDKKVLIESSVIDCHHNYITLENHFNRNVYVTRKGAISAREGQLGVIPGSMGTKSFIVEGLGNKESFTSCSHGAGRIMSRTQAKKLITLKEHEESLEGVECNNTSTTLDESPRAYKDIDRVMDSQTDLVKIIHTLKQVVCLKG